MGRQNLDRDLPIKACIACPIDFAHAARTQFRLDLVRPKFSARGKAHTVVIISSPGVKRGRDDSGRRKGLFRRRTILLLVTSGVRYVTSEQLSQPIS